jgi:hypothetical protein
VTRYQFCGVGLIVCGIVAVKLPDLVAASGAGAVTLPAEAIALAAVASMLSGIQRWELPITNVARLSRSMPIRNIFRLKQVFFPIFQDPKYSRIAC